MGNKVNNQKGENMNNYDYELPTFNPKPIKKLGQKEMEILFKKICNAENWKLGIEAMIPKAKFADYDQAVIHFTGGGLKIVTNEDKNGMVGVVGYGYYHHIGG